MSNGEEDDTKEMLEDLRKAVDEINAYYEELDGESPRASAILAISGLQDELEKLILTKFPGVSPKVWRELAGPGFTPLGSFKSLNCFAVAFSFYGPKTNRMLETMSSVRNKFAHETTARDFSHPEILPLMKKLADNPIQPFTWKDHLTSPQLKKIFLDLTQQTEKQLMIIKAEYLFPTSPAPCRLA